MKNFGLKRSARRTPKWIAAIMMSIMIGTILGGCGKEAVEEQPGEAQVAVGENPETKETEGEEAVVETSEEATEAVEPTEEVVAEETEAVEESVVEEPATEEPASEMVDFETWAKQEGNDEVCLVVWNEELGKQEIMTPFWRSGDSLDEPEMSPDASVYEIQEGDRFAVPFNSNIEGIKIVDGEKFIFENSEYVEIPLKKGVAVDLYIFYRDENGEKFSLYYIFI